MTFELSETTSGWPPERTVFPVTYIDLRILEGEHPFHTEQKPAVQENWTKEVAANPALFDGRMILQHRLSVSEEGIVGEGYVIPFSTFMWWRKQVPRKEGFHLFAYAVLETRDGALVAIRMGEHTANAGQVYFAAGSFEEIDVVDGRCDIEGNMRREVLEETGLDLRVAAAGEGYFASQDQRVVTVFRLFRFDMTAQEMVERIERHMLVAEDKEIAGAVAIGSADHGAHPYNLAMLPVIDWYFKEKR